MFCQDAPTGLRAIIAIYSTALGPALGGTRFYPYPDEDAALADVLNLSRAMAYKNAMAGLDHGGGKAVIIGDPARLKSEALLRAYGRFVQSLNGRYITACDVGTYSEDMDLVARECQYVTGRTVRNGGAGDSSVLTAFGVFQGMRAAAEHVWGTQQPATAARSASRASARSAATSSGTWSTTAPRWWSTTWTRARWTGSGPSTPGSRRRTAARACSPAPSTSTRRARSAARSTTTPWRLLNARIICGGANNQLAHPGIEKLLADRGIVYAPDYVVNSGGVIQVADELSGFSFERAEARAAQIFDTTKKILTIADQEDVPPAVAADRLAERRMSEVGRLRGIWLNSWLTRRRLGLTMAVGARRAKQVRLCVYGGTSALHSGGGEAAGRLAVRESPQASAR